MAARLLLLALLIATGCVPHAPRRSAAPDRPRFDVEKEREQGFQFDQELQRHIPLIDDPVVLDVVNELGQSLVAQIEPQPFIYRFRVVVDPGLNAFAVPGGFIYLHSGTVRSAASVDELAGVLGHEIGHVKGHHVARLQEQARIPNLLTTFAGIAAAVGTGEPGFVVAAQGINVALQLQYTRKFEDEADHTGSIFMARAGHSPTGMVHFFERILLSSRRPSVEIPPYLYSHPDVEARIATVERYAQNLTVAPLPSAVSESELRSAQTRLALLIEEGRTRWPLASTPTAPEATAPLLREAARLAQTERPQQALAVLDEAETLDPADPRIPFLRGELLEALSRDEEAIAAYRRTLRLDPTRPLPYYQLARAYTRTGDPTRATYHLEHVVRRSPPGAALRERASFELLKLTFPVILESGLADGAPSDAGDTVAGFSRESFSATDTRMAWWGATSARWVDVRHKIRVRWMDPSGRVVQDSPAQPLGRPYVMATLELPPELARRTGVWQLEALLEDDVVLSRAFHLRP